MKLNQKNLKKLSISLLFLLCISILLAQKTDEKTRVDTLTASSEDYIGESIDSVLKYSNKAIAIAQKTHNEEAIITNYLFIQKAYYYDNKMDSAIIYAQKALSFSNSFKNDEKTSQIFHALGLIYYKTGELDSALICYQKEYELVKKLGDLKKKASALGNIGMVFYRQSKYQKAIDNYFECLKIFQSLGDRHKEIVTYNNIGNVYRFWEDYPKALFYYKKAGELNKLENDKRFDGFIYNNLAIVYRKQKSYDSAIIYYNKAKNIYKEVNYEKGVASALTGIAITYNKLDEFDKAFETYLQAIEIQKKVKDRIGLASNYGNIGILMLDKNMPHKAIKYLKISDSLAVVTGYRELQKNNYESFRDAYSMLDDYKKALDYELRFVAMKDSIFNIEKLKEIEDVQEKYQAEQKQHRIDILNEQAHIKDIKLSRKNVFIISLALIILLSLVIGWLINHNNKTKARKHLIILENRLLRSQMNPHFLFNSLNAIQTYILRKNPLEGASYLAKFAELMRSILYNSREEYIPLEKELKMINNYLELQQIRFNNLFSFSINTDPDINLKSTYIPPMLAQPFIENAVEHGFKDIDYPGYLDVTFKLKNETILITIKDNGVGVDRSAEQNKGNEKLHKSLATVISKERLDLFNKRMKKELFSLNIKQLEDEKGRITGTEVSLVIPFKKGEG